LFISSLTVYPVKSCRGIALDSALLTASGIDLDREWMVVEPDGEFVTQRELPRLALIEPRLTADTLELAAPDMPPLTVALAPHANDRDSLQVRVWRDRVAALDEGDEAAYWLSEFLRVQVRLVRFAPAARRLSNKEFTGEFDSAAKFADGYALLVIAEASLADLNRRLAAKSLAALPMNRFRPNVVIAGDDVGPYDEDRMLWLRGNGIALKPVKACIRCQITGTDQALAATSAEPLLTLATYRVHAELGGPAFGQNVIVVQGVGSTLRTGMPLEAEWNF
jgi:uncharacterized protein YcbX